MRKKNILKTNQNLQCPLCREEHEMPSYLIFSCKIIYQVWLHCYTWIGGQLALPQTCCKHFWQHFGAIPREQVRKLWVIIHLATILSLWLHGNEVVFKDQQPCGHEVMKRIMLRLWIWIKAKNPGAHFSYHDQKIQPLLCLKTLV